MPVGFGIESASRPIFARASFCLRVPVMGSRDAPIHLRVPRLQRAATFGRLEDYGWVVRVGGAGGLLR